MDAIHPFREGKERARFLRASGVDTELDKYEFQLDQKRKNGFVRSYDRWALLARFDADRNKTLDWFECKSYRDAIWVVLLAKHDVNTNGSLDPDEHHDAIHALLDGKLAAYLNISCCGETLKAKDGTPIGAPFFPLGTTNETSLEEMIARNNRRKELAIQDVRMIGGKSETELMPHTELMEEEELSRMLDPHYERELVDSMPKEHWFEYRSSIYRQLKWYLAGDPDGLVARSDMLLNYIGTHASVSDPMMDSAIRMETLYSPPVHRLGLADKAVVVRRMKPMDLRSASERNEIRKWPAEIRKTYETEQRVLTLRAVARIAGVSIDATGREIPDQPDRYRKIEIHAIYNPLNTKGSPFLHLPSLNERPFIDDPDRELSSYLHATE